MKQIASSKHRRSKASTQRQELAKKDGQDPNNNTSEKLNHSNAHKSEFFSYSSKLEAVQGKGQVLVSLHCW